MTSFRAACVQLRTGRDVAANIAAAEALIRAAAGGGAHYIQTPEQTALMELERKVLFATIVAEDDDPALKRFRALAAELGVWLHIGSLAIRIGEQQAANRAFVIAPDGAIAARYDKVHMFDVDLPSGERYRESATYAPGSKAVVVDLPWLRLGVTICYDLRFAALYRSLAKAGAGMLAIPAAFTQVTGEAHWHVLQRARAIETGSFIVSAAQGGHHENGRHTYGHSLIIDPWGRVVAEAGQEPGIIVADIDSAACDEARARIPALQHDRAFTLEEAGAVGAARRAS
ncbi:MAG: carbon-nitrogen hydrolase family protein [Rhodobiaceae bacterium]|nr:carbon-nitrogen hydrolase family protein [Rhodobiaceae bacterium]MCC0054447.1 carbon-nitrogen hydrolase family protein [Rhodobiaceae bacterium]